MGGPLSGRRTRRPHQVKIAALQPSVSIILDRLGRLDTLVACTRYCLAAVPSLRARSIAVVQDSWSTRTEELLAARPDLVIASVPYRQESLAAILKAGCPVLALAPHSLADIEQDIGLIASIANAVPEGEALISAMRSGSRVSVTAAPGWQKSPSSIAKNGASRSSIRSTGSGSSSRPPAVSLWGSPAQSPRRRPSPRPIPTSSSRPGAEPATACRWTKWRLGRDGKRFRPSATAVFSASPTSFSTRPRPPCWRDCRR